MLQCATKWACDGFEYLSLEKRFRKIAKGEGEMKFKSFPEPAYVFIVL